MALATPNIMAPVKAMTLGFFVKILEGLCTLTHEGNNPPVGDSFSVAEKNFFKAAKDESSSQSIDCPAYVYDLYIVMASTSPIHSLYRVASLIVYVYIRSLP